MTAVTDRELLTLAAKAAGEQFGPENFLAPDEIEGIGGWGMVRPDLSFWNPLTDDGDALRLAVKLGVEIRYSRNEIRAIVLDDEGKCREFCVISRSMGAAGARRVIVMCAANIGSAS